MERYANVDKVLEELKREARIINNPKHYSVEDADYIIEFNATADVVPRADYDKLLQENAELKRRLGAAIEDLRTAACEFTHTCFACKNEKQRDAWSGKCGIDGCGPKRRKWEWRDSQREG